MVGMALLVTGTWVRTDSRFREFLSERYRNVVQEAFWQAPTLYFFSYILIILGAVMIVVAFFGCCGAIRESGCMLITVFFLLFYLNILENVAILSVFLPCIFTLCGFSQLRHLSHVQEG